jgi:predicted NBD/HSP70 family sugar kinase
MATKGPKVPFITFNYCISKRHLVQSLPLMATQSITQPPREWETIGHKGHAILNAIREKGRLSRLQISQDCDLTITTTKRLVNGLIDAGVLMEGSSLNTMSRGKKPTVVELNPAYGFCVGVVIEPGHVRIAGLDLCGRTIYDRDLSPNTENCVALQGLLFAEIDAAINACRAPEHLRLLGIGIGIAGLVDSRSGTILYCPGLPGWENVRLAEIVAGRFGVSVVLDEAVRCMALAEKRYGVGQSLDTFVFLYIGAGVGAGIVVDNRIYRGMNGLSGEFGHITIRENGPICSCGNRGCLEALVSNHAILARVRELIAAGVYISPGTSNLRGTLSLQQLYQAAVQGDKVASMVVAEIEENLGIGMADLIDVYDPGTVILAGQVVEQLHELILDGVERIMRRRAMHAISQRTKVIKSAFASDMGALGAATLVIEWLLETSILNL